MPSIEMIELIKSFNAIIGIQVTSKESNEKAITLGTDNLVCQGTQAGGHVQASKTLDKTLKEVFFRSYKQQHSCFGVWWYF